MVIPNKTAHVTGTTLRTTGTVSEDLGSEHHRYAIARPDKLGTEQMTVDGIHKCTPSGERNKSCE